MGTSSENTRAFIQYSRVEIINDSLPENAYEKFSIGVFADPQKQFFITFYTFAGIPSVKLESACGSWTFLYECQDILEKLSRVDTENFKPEDLYYILLSLDIRDITEELNNTSK